VDGIRGSSPNAVDLTAESAENAEGALGLTLNLTLNRNLNLFADVDLTAEIAENAEGGFGC